jgi:branched-subunit amino acid transport protein
MTTMMIFILGGIGTYALRSVMIVNGGRIAGSDWLEGNISLVSPAVLAAIVASSLLVTSGSIELPNPVVLVAMAGAMFAVRRTGNVSAALAVGLPIYWLGAAAGLV